MGKKKILLSDVDALTFYKDKYTTYRRTSAIPQLKCVGGDACNLYVPDVVQCYNRGSDGNDIQWACSATTGEYRLGSINVACEGYDSPDDRYVLVGSCGLEYTLYKRTNDIKSEDSWSGFTNFFLFVAIVFFVFRFCCVRPALTAPVRDQDLPPPPPYSQYDKYQQPASTSSGPGFWTGMATGGALGYAAGRSSSSRNDNSNRERKENNNASTSTGFGGTTRR